MRLLPDNVTLIIAGGKHPCNPGDETRQRRSLSLRVISVAHDTPRSLP